MNNKKDDTKPQFERPNFGLHALSNAERTEAKKLFGDNIYDGFTKQVLTPSNNTGDSSKSKDTNYKGNSSKPKGPKP